MNEKNKKDEGQKVLKSIKFRNMAVLIHARN